MVVRLGIEDLLGSRALDGLRVGLVCNPSSVDAELGHVADRLTAHTGAPAPGASNRFRQPMQLSSSPGVTVPAGWSRVGSAVTLMRERVRTEARSALDAGEAGRAGHQERVVYTMQRPTCKPNAEPPIL